MMGGLERARVGLVPIVWNNVDQPDLNPEVPATTILDETARLGYAGCQFGRGFPEGHALAEALADRGLALAEVYAEIPMTPDGPTADALEIGRRRLGILRAARGEVLVPAIQVGGGRSEWAARAADPAAPRLTDEGWARLATLLETLGREAAAGGHRLAFHGHAGTYVETPHEIERLMSATDPEVVGLCLDVGHYMVAGGDPVAAIRHLGDRILHVHLKDVAAEPLAALRSGALADFGAAIRERLFTELGAGVLDLSSILAALADRRYSGWLMVEQDTSWLPPSESAAIGRRVLAFATRELERRLAA